MISVAVARRQSWGFIDAVEIEPIGILRVVGWSRLATGQLVPPIIELDDRAVPYLKAYRYHRPDVAAGPEQLVPQAGIVFEYRLPDELLATPLPIRVLRLDGRKHTVRKELPTVVPHYGALLDTAQILHRDDVYGTGPPSPVAPPELMVLVGGVTGRILDFGCGSGALVAWLRQRGLDAWGLELDVPLVRNAVPADRHPYVTFYDGKFPIPFVDGAFDCVIVSEVLEHIPDPAAAVREVARVTSGLAVITVPDSEAIPAGFPHHLVPWHLLESSHLNFFTQRSLATVLASHFTAVEFGRLGGVRLNDSRLYESVVAACRK